MFQNDFWQPQEFTTPEDLNKFESDMIALKLLDVQKYTKGG